MVLLNAQFREKFRSLIKMARQEKIRCVRLEENLFYAARRAKGHGRYLIYLDATKSGVFATCRSIHGAACPSYRGCVHIAKVYECLIAELNKRERQSHRSEAA